MSHACGALPVLMKSAGRTGLRQYFRQAAVSLLERGRDVIGGIWSPNIAQIQRSTEFDRLRIFLSMPLNRRVCT